MKLTHLFLLMSALCMIACNDDDNGFDPNEAIKKTFQLKYPTATELSWEQKSAYVVADFRVDHLESSAWFEQIGTWHMTVTELERKELLPETVSNVFNSGEYGTWHVDDIDRVERANKETLYVIEVEKDKQELDLYYSENGILIKTIEDNGSNDYENYLLENLPESIIDFINTRYSGARIIDIETEHNRLEIDILHNNRGKEIQFNNMDYAWILTKYDVAVSEISAAVMTTLNNSEYASYRIDDVEFYETPDASYYRFELESGSTEVVLKIDTEGNVIP